MEKAGHPEQLASCLAVGAVAGAGQGEEVRGQPGPTSGQRRQHRRQQQPWPWQQGTVSVSPSLRQGRGLCFCLCIICWGWRGRRDRECDGGWGGESPGRSRSDERFRGKRCSLCSAARQRGTRGSCCWLLLWRAWREQNTGLSCDVIVVVFFDND